MEIFYIMFITGVALFLGSFKFKQVDIIFLLLSSITFIMLGGGLFSGDIQIITDSREVYSYGINFTGYHWDYDNSDVPNNIDPKLFHISKEYTYLSGSYLLFLEVLFMVFGLYLFFISVYSLKENGTRPRE